MTHMFKSGSSQCIQLNVVDLIVDLDHPVALLPAQHKVGGEGGPMSPLATTAGAQGSGSTSVNSRQQQQQQQQPAVETRRSTVTGGGGDVVGAHGSSCIGSSSGAAPRASSPTGPLESLIVRPKNFVPGETEQG
ncbi:hypothetical protein VaNZ11_001493 [Volvox africanus]|uniref:Uncharacterized protein n=1 Tax=Volvox africanus TaxID=51714 RepID=A0ABQ5RPX0_9CHLO|nr:hypothetical protein VaNZ11_001493 [Volvox africanus]